LNYEKTQIEGSSKAVTYGILVKMKEEVLVVFRIERVL
jgi:hypothetical protein